MTESTAAPLTPVAGPLVPPPASPLSPTPCRYRGSAFVVANVAAAAVAVPA